MRQIFALTLFVLLSTMLFAQDGWDNWKPYSSESYYAIQKDSSQKVESENYDVYNPKFYVTKMQNRFLSVDKLADQYPSVTPYHYVLNNPMRFIDPTGMWVASYDSSGNVVSVNYEEGDTYENLYSQLGISAEDFSKKYGVDLSKGITTTSFDITSYVTINRNYSGGSVGNANCVSFVLNATNTEIPKAMSVNIGGETVHFPAEESAIIDENFGSTLQNKYGYASTSNPEIGDVAVFTGNYNNNPNNSIHTGIYIIKNQAGDPQYISRNGQGASVSVSTLSGYRNLYLNASPSVPIKSIIYYTK